VSSERNIGELKIRLQLKISLSKDFDWVHLPNSIFWENLGHPEKNLKSSQDNKIDDLI